MLAAIATLLLAVGATPVPKATGPIPVTADSYPFMAANKSTPAFDLSKVGYVEEEYIVSGVGQCLRLGRGWRHQREDAECSLHDAHSGSPAVSGFSGTVVVELLFPARRSIGR